MTQRLAAGTVVLGDGGDSFRVAKLLGAGGQGEVYEVALVGSGETYALKWYYPPGRGPRAQAMAQEQRRALKEYIIPRGAPDPRFVWPLQFVEGPPGSGVFGYVMRLWDAGFVTLEKLVCGRVSITDRALISAALGIVEAFRKLHLSGAVYKDINLGGFALSPATGAVLVVDNDNVRTNGTPGAILFPGFGAPEVVTGKAPCTSQTDDHSLAVLLFYMFVRGNPMEGNRELVQCYDASAARALFGEHALFVFDPKDDSNRPVAGVHEAVLKNWPTLPGDLRAAFGRAFGEGLHDPGRRLTDGEWVTALSGYRDSLYACGHCRRETVYERAALKDAGAGNPAGAGVTRANTAATGLTCVWCHKALSPPARMKLGPLVVMLSPDLKLYPHHLGETADFSSPVAEMSAHPSRPGAWGLKNLSPRAWTYEVERSPGPAASSTETLSAHPGQSVPIKDGLRIRFGRVEGVVRL